MKPGEEFILTIQSLDEVSPDASRIESEKFTIISDPSDAPNRKELELASIVRGYIRQLADRDEQEDLPENIRLPQNLYIPHENIEGDEFAEDDEIQEFYVPNFSDYESRVDGERSPFYIRSNSNPNYQGDVKVFTRFLRSDRLFDISIDERVVQTPGALQEATACLNQAFSNLFRVIGQPFDLDGKKEIDILVSELPGGSRNAVARFNHLDRFATSEGREIQDSNHQKEILYLSTRLLQRISGRSTAGRICSTTAHELQHLINFDFKVLRHIPEEERSELASIRKYQLQKERLGMDEALSHLVEELSDGDQEVYRRVRHFMERSGSGSFSMESGFSNSKVRGANLALVYFALAQSGGKLDLKDPLTAKFLKDRIQSKDIGWSNLAAGLNWSAEKFLTQFYESLDTALYDPEAAAKLFPEPRRLDSGVTRGVRILDRNSSVREWKDAGPASIHPLATDLPLLSRAQTARLLPESFVRYRWLPPAVKPIRQKQKIEVQGGRKPYLVILTRVR